MTTPNLRQLSDNTFLPRDMKCLGFDTKKNCYVFRKRNEIWLGIFGARWDGAKLVRLGKIEQSTLDGGVLDDLTAVPEYPPDYTETSPMELVGGLGPMMSTPSTPSETSTPTSAPGSMENPGSNTDFPDTLWGVAGVSITASGAPPPDNENRLRKRASHIISSIRSHHPHLFHANQRNGQEVATSQRRPNSRASLQF